MHKQLMYAYTSAYTDNPYPQQKRESWTHNKKHAQVKYPCKKVRVVKKGFIPTV